MKDTKDEIEALRIELTNKELELERIKADYAALKAKYLDLCKAYETKLRELQEKSELDELQAQEAWLQGELSGWNMGWNSSGFDDGMW